MANTVLSTTYQSLGYFTCQEGSNYRFYVKAKYSVTVGGTADIHISLNFTGANVSGTGRATVNSGTAESFSFSRNAESELSTYRITYASDGTSTDNSLTIALSNMSATWPDGTSFNAKPTRSSLSFTFDLPPIDQRISISLNAVSGFSNTFHSFPVAGISSFDASLSLRYARTAYIEATGAGISETYVLSPTYVANEIITQSVHVFPSNSDYSLNIKYQASNNRESMYGTRTYAIKGYSVPTFANGTYTRRCDSSGNSDPNGEYGRLYLTWTVTEVDPDDPNTLQLCTVKLNNTVISKTAGSIQDGYLDYIFPLAQNVQGNLEIYLEDEISNNTITSLVVPKSTMPLSLYQNGNSVGVAIGRMATQSGFWCYEQFYLKSSTNNSSKIFNIQVDDNGQITATEV